MTFQIANKVMCDSPGLVDLAIRLVKSVFHLPDVNFFLWRLWGGGGRGVGERGEEFNITEVL